ncbi:MAG: hypothetical protein FD180_3592 [Planctomycetota bacterium]|nr:MAG: hypothetical protein FD180_3592 [Planctomycetota bacterium]
MDPRDLDLPLPPLDMTPAEAHARFAELQARLVPLWRSMRDFTQDEQTIVVVASMSADMAVTSSEMQAYEERFLFLLLLLRQPAARLVYVTSQPINPAVIEYYLNLLPGVVSWDAKRRLHLVAVEDATVKPLTVKLLERPGLIARIRALVKDPRRAHLVPYNTTLLERDLALRLGIPMYGADPKYFDFGTKTGCRRLFAEEGVAHPLGFEGLSTLEEVAARIGEIRAARPRAGAAIVKLNEGLSGEGNAFVDLAVLPAPGAPGEKDAIASRLAAMRFELGSMTRDDFARKLSARGGVVEERIAGRDFRSPSVQLRVTPLGEIEVLSTHDQVLGGPSGQSFLGCRFPADVEYAAAITRDAAKIGRRLAKEGVLGRFAIDFVVCRNEAGGWDHYAIEINLRKGGTTHPFLTLKFLTDGVYDPEAVVFRAPSGRPKCFVANDHLHNARYRSLTPELVLELISKKGIHFDQTRQTGCVFHMMCALGECGRIGVTAVGESHAEAEAMYGRAVAALDEEAAAQLAARPVPKS